MATPARGYGPKRSEYLVFDGEETNYEKWEVKLLTYLSLRKLKKTVLCEGGNDATKNEEAFSEIVQLLDDRSLSLVMRDAKDDGRKALIKICYTVGFTALYFSSFIFDKQQHE